MTDDIIGLIPILTSLSGSTLTAKNWQESAISTCACVLSSLLIKPGIEVLAKLPNLNTYFGCKDHLVLNASALEFKGKSQQCVLRSPYDGSLVSLGYDGLAQLIKTLAPSYLLICPDAKELLNDIPSSTRVFISDVDNASNHLSSVYGVYFHFNSQHISLDAFCEQIEHAQGSPCYVMGDLDMQALKVLAERGAKFLESDRPAFDACKGLVYTENGVVSITDREFEYLFEPLDSICICPTCEQKLTAAYLHHLFEHTPLLCQRLLIQHNVYFCQNMIHSLYLRGKQ